MTDMTYMKPVRLAEWSKALDSGSSLFVGVGSNPTADNRVNFYFSQCCVDIRNREIKIVYCILPNIQVR